MDNARQACAGGLQTSTAVSAALKLWRPSLSVALREPRRVVLHAAQHFQVRFIKRACAKAELLACSDTHVSLPSLECSEVPTPSESDCTETSPSVTESDSPWTPPSPRRAAWLQSSPATKAARRVDALLTLAARHICVSDNDDVPTPAASPWCGATEAALTPGAADMPDGLKKAVINYALWKARNEALQALGKDKRAATTVVSSVAASTTPLASQNLPLFGKPLEASPETAGLVAQSQEMQHQLLRCQLDSARENEAKLRAALDAGEARSKQLHHALEEATAAHMSDLDAARATFAVTESVISELMRIRHKLQRDNERLRQRLAELKQRSNAHCPAPAKTERSSWLSGLLSAAISRLRPTTRLELNGEAVCPEVAFVLTIRLF